MIDPYLNPVTGKKWKLTQIEREFIASDTATSRVLLAQQFGVNPRLIDFIQSPAKYYANNEYTKAYRKKRRAENPTPRKVKRVKPKPIVIDKYEEAVHHAVEEGAGVWDIEAKLNESLSTLVRNRLEIEKQISEVHKMQTALYKYVDITPVTLSPDFELRKNEEVIHMTKKEMKWYMVECGLTSKKLAEEMKGKYSVRAIASYREGQSPVPRDVAELLRGFPRKTHLEVM